MNLLREGIDLPEVALVAILDADKVGFLRSGRSLIQTAGRAARNSNGRVILYADDMTPGIKELVSQTAARRKKQLAYNKKHNITPVTIKKEHKQTIAEIIGASKRSRSKRPLPDFSANTINGDGVLDLDSAMLDANEKAALISELTSEMLAAADALEFERAATLRDRIKELRG